MRVPNKAVSINRKRILFRYFITRIPVQLLFITVFNENFLGGEGLEVKRKPAESIQTSLLTLRSDKRFMKLLTRDIF